MKTNSTSLIKTSLMVLLVISSIILGCKKDEDENPGTNEVWMQSSSFNPSTITVAKNTTITWTNKDNTNHTATSDSGAFNSGTVGDGGTFSFQFNDLGTFDYHCNFHTGMKGKVIVN